MSLNHLSNQQLHSISLPDITSIVYEKLESKYLTTRFISAGILVGSLILLAVILILTLDFPNSVERLIIGLVVLISLLILSYQYYSYHHMGYAIRELDTVFKKGVIWRSQVIVPSNRIQHIEINQGFVERMYGLASLKIFTAGGSSSDLSIPGLSFDTARKLKSFLLGKIEDATEEE